MIDQYLDALNALDLILETFGETFWRSEIKKDIEAWKHRKSTSEHLSHYGAMGSFNDIVFVPEFVRNDFPSAKVSRFNRYFLDTQTVAYTLAKNHGNSLSISDMALKFGLAGTELIVLHCKKCSTNQTTQEEIDRFVANYYARKEIIEHYETATISKMVQERSLEDCSDLKSKALQFHEILNKSAIVLTEKPIAEQWQWNECVKCGLQSLHLKYWRLSSAEGKLKEVEKGDYTLSQNILDAFK